MNLKYFDYCDDCENTNKSHEDIEKNWIIHVKMFYDENKIWDFEDCEKILQDIQYYFHGVNSKWANNISSINLICALDDLSRIALHLINVCKNEHPIGKSYLTKKLVCILRAIDENIENRSI
jgi:hypothetical protein